MSVTTITPDTADLAAARRRRWTLLLVPAFAAALFAGPAALPSDAGVPTFLAAAQAQASPADCWSVASRTYAVTRGDFAAAIQAIRATGGCGDSVANGLCSASRQWWGGWARGVVRFITAGRYSTC